MIFGNYLVLPQHIGGSTEANQAGIGPGDSSVDGNTSMEKSGPIDGVTPAKDIDLDSEPMDIFGDSEKDASDDANNDKLNSSNTPMRKSKLGNEKGKTRNKQINQQITGF